MADVIFWKEGGGSIESDQLKRATWAVECKNNFHLGHKNGFVS